MICYVYLSGQGFRATIMDKILGTNLQNIGALFT